MPEIYKVIFLIGMMWNFIYVFSYAYYQLKNRNYKGFVGICLVLTSIFILFSFNLESF